MKLSLKQKTLSGFFFSFSKFRISFEHFKRKDDLYS